MIFVGSTTCPAAESALKASSAGNSITAARLRRRDDAIILTQHPISHTHTHTRLRLAVIVCEKEWNG